MKKSDSFDWLFLEEDNYDDFSKQIQYILETKPFLTSENIYKLIKKINIYYLREKNKKVDKSYFDQVLNLYDICINEKDRFDVLLTINDKESFFKYAKKHYQFFKKKFQETVFVDEYSIDELDTFEEIESLFYYNFKDTNYKLKLISLDETIIYPICKLFLEDINFYYNDSIIKYCHKYLSLMNFKELGDIFSYALKKEFNKNYIDELLTTFNKKITRHNVSYEEINSLMQIDNKEILEILISCLKQPHILTNSNNIVIDNFNKLLRNKIKGYDFGDDILDDLFSLKYINALNKLEMLSSSERKKEPLYLKCFQIFLKEFLSKYKDKITKEEIKIIEALFQRVINRKNIFQILKIDNKKTLYHYYKSGKFNLNINTSFEIVKNYNAKQYLELNSLFNKKDIERIKKLNIDKDNLINKDNWAIIDTLNTQERDVVEKILINIDKINPIIIGTLNIQNLNITEKVIINFDKDNQVIIDALKILGYDITKKIINKDFTKLDYITTLLKQKPTDYIEKIKPLLLDIIDISTTKEEYTISAFFTCFNLLYEQKNTKIKFMRIKNMVDSIAYALFPNNYNIENNLEKLNFVHKGMPLSEKVEGIKLYNNYRFRLYSSIPDIKGKVNNCEYEMVDMHSEEIISNGIEKYIVKDKLISSCLTPAGKASSCLRHGAINPHGRFFKVTYQDNIVSYSWVWRTGEVLCFDNIEVTENSYKLDNPEYIIYTAYKNTAETIREITAEKENSGIKLVIIGRNDIDVSNSFLDELPKVNDYTENLFKPNSKEYLYLEDSSKKQLILSGKYKDDLKTDDIEPIYKYRRKEVKRFSNCDKYNLRREINSIYFDYCLENNNKYEKITTNYIDGYLNEDWFIGYKDNNTYDFYYRGNDKRLFKEAKTHLKNEDLKITSVPNIIKTPKENIDILLNIKNYQFNIEKILAYLQNDKRQQFELKEKYYTHRPNSLETFSKILKDNAITSAKYGRHAGGIGCNGENFISVARVNSGVYNSYAGSKTFILTDNICVFGKPAFEQERIAIEFLNSKYPLRNPNYDGELHVLDKINLDKSIGIFASQIKIDELVQITYLQELFQNNIPLILFEDNTYIDKEVIKKYSKVLK